MTTRIFAAKSTISCFDKYEIFSVIEPAVKIIKQHEPAIWGYARKHYNQVHGLQKENAKLQKKLKPVEQKYERKCREIN